MFTLDTSSLPAELVPLSWLIGRWEGTGVIAYSVGDDEVDREFAQQVEFRLAPGPSLEYRAEARVLDQEAPFFVETGFWCVTRGRGAADAGPGMLPPNGEPVFTTAESVETLRDRENDGFPLEVSITRPDGVSEHYYGLARGPRIDLATNGVLVAETAREYRAATRLYGLVEDHLLWAWDMAAFGQELRSHASARLARVTDAPAAETSISESPDAAAPGTEPTDGGESA